MSWRVVKCVLDHHDSKVGGDDLLVLIFLANHANGDDGSGAWPSQVTLAGETGRARRTVQRVLGRLATIGALEVEQRPGRTHRFRVRMCAVCLPSPSASQRRIGTNQGASQSPGGASQSPGGCVTVTHEPFIEPVREPPNAVGASPRAQTAPPERPTGSEEIPSSNRKEDPTPPESGRAEFLARRVEQIRQEQGERAAKAYLAKVALNDATDERRAELDRLHSGATPESYSGYVPAWAQEQWRAQHPKTDLEQETGA